MVGIIYKFTIVAKYKMDGCKPFYVGQYSGSRFESYWGSGDIWRDFIKKLKQDFPNCWKKFVKREILYHGECNQKTLNKLEEIYIRREHALYFERRGGCNVLPGAAIENNPSQSERFRALTRERMMGNDFFLGKTHSKETRKFLSDTSRKQWGENPNSGFSGKHHSDSTRQKISVALQGLKRSEEFCEKCRMKKNSQETRQKLSEANKRWAEDNPEEVAKRIKRLKEVCPTPMKGRRHSEETKERLRQAALRQFAEKGVPFKGHKHTEESKEKMRKSHKK